MAYPWMLVNAGKRSGVDTSKLALQIACVILLFFMAFRALSVGVDTKFYGYTFHQFGKIPFSQIFDAKLYAQPGENWSFDFEPGYRLYNKLISLLSDSQQLITVVNSVLIIGFLYLWLQKESPNALLSVWLYLTLGIYQTEMNVVRNAISLFMIYYAMHDIQEKKFRQYAAIVIAASMFHKSALVFLPLYFLIGRVRLSVKRIVILILTSAAVGMNYSTLGFYVRAIMPSSLDKYFTVSNGKMETLIVGVLYAAVVLFLVCFMNRQEQEKAIAESPNGAWMFTLNICFFGLNIGLGSAARMAALFGPYIILYIPQMLECVSEEEKRKKLTALIVLICGCQYILRMLINNIGGTQPYQFFF